MSQSIQPGDCPVMAAKVTTAKSLSRAAVELGKAHDRKNLIWLEATGCSGNIISLLNAESPDIIDFFLHAVHLTYSNSLMAPEGTAAFDRFLETLDTEFILVVEGAVATKAEGFYNVLARYGDHLVTAMEAVGLAGMKAQHVLAVGTCASYGGPSAARPNPSGSLSIPDFLDRPVIRVPGCPSHPDWVIGTIGHLLAYGLPTLDDQQRPTVFYGITIHDRCPRRSYFDQGIFAQQLGEAACMFRLGCRGPITQTDCPVREWNGYLNWPIGDNTPCIGCARSGFPDLMEPFVRY